MVFHRLRYVFLESVFSAIYVEITQMLNNIPCGQDKQHKN